MQSGRRSPLRVLVAGGGVAAFEATLALRALAEERVSVELLAPEADFTYRPLAVAEPFRAGEVRRFPLQALAREAGAELRRGAVVSVDPHRRVVATREGEELSYDVLLLALGSRPREAVPNALTFCGPEDGPAFGALLEEAVTGDVRSLAFALPAGVAWPLPLYELALLTANYLTDRGAMGAEVTVVTPEDAPLGLFGRAASGAIRELLEIRGIVLRVRTTPVSFELGALQVVPEGRIEADRVVALPRFEGPRIPGVPHDGEGFVRTDEHGRVTGLDDVYAAGDLTQFPVKQGGIAAQQADAAAEAIAVQAGAPVEPTPFRPVLRGLLLTGMFPRYLRGEVGKDVSTESTEALWWPPAKIVGRHLARFLAARMGLSESPPRLERESAVRVEVELDPRQAGAWPPI
ncbi:MAG: FAD/NAD(P)-binding oxidoreductase [Actinomycetota bacterium]